MKRNTFSYVLSALVAGLGIGFAEPAFSATTTVPVGVSQSEDVLYALTLVNTDHTPYDGTQSDLQVCLTVSVPRNGVMGVAPTLRAVPATIMYRPHGGEGTAWSGAIYMTAETTGYYPMPQEGTVKRDVVTNGAAIDATTFTMAEGTLRDPARWERRFFSNTLTVDTTNPENTNPLIASLLAGEATYEWYAASRYGLGLFTIVSDIQDHGRKMDFTDIRLWDGTNDGTVEDTTDNDWNEAHFGSEKYNHYVLNSMSTAANGGWTLKKVALGSAGNNVADKGALLLEDSEIHLDDMIGVNAAHDDCPMIESPAYPDGISLVTFDMRAYLANEASPQYLLIQASDGTTWSSEGIQFSVEGGAFVEQQLSTTSLRLIKADNRLSSVTVKFDSATSGRPGNRFRILRVTSYADVDAAVYQRVILVRSLRVQSAKPDATFEVPYVLLDGENGVLEKRPAATPDDDFSLCFKVNPNQNAMPRGYSAKVTLSRRADSDVTCGSYTKDLSVAFDGNTLETVLKADFSPIHYEADVLGAYKDLYENSFYVRDGKVEGLANGVYNVTLHCDLLGSFAAGRTKLDQREGESRIFDGVLSNPDDELSPKRPLLLEVREKDTRANKVDLILTYRTQDGGNLNYVMRETEIPCLAEGLNDGAWYTMVPRKLPVAIVKSNADDSTANEPEYVKFLDATSTETRDNYAEYAWAETPEDATLEGEYAKTATANLVNFRVRAIVDGKEYWFGQDETPTGMPTTSSPYPGTTLSLAAGVTPPNDPLAPEARASVIEQITPILVDVAELATTHLRIGFNENGDLTTSRPSLSICGANDQNFNTWDAAADGLFSDTDFRENVKFMTADFNATIQYDEDRDAYEIADGWLPDQGPFALTTELTDTFTVGRSDQVNELVNYAFFMGNFATQAADSFASWGASSVPAVHTRLRNTTAGSATDLTTEYYNLGSSSNEVVLARDINRLLTTGEGNYQPDAMIRLSGSAINQATQRTDIPILKGIGEVSFKLSRSEPYDINKACLYAQANYSYRGVGATINTNTPSKSGFSTSLYLADWQTSPRTYYELRLTQILRFNEDSPKERPSERVIMELWTWSGSTATRLPLQGANGENYHIVNIDSMDGKIARLWVDKDRKLKARFNNANEITSAATVAKNSFPYVAVGSAECWPSFKSMTYSQNGEEPQTPLGTNGVGFALSPDAVWTAGESSGACQLTRTRPDASSYATVKLMGKPVTGASEIQLATFSATDVEKEYRIVVGRADLSLSLVAEGNNAVFIDDLRMTSWQGDDTVRNGSYVPQYTNTRWDDAENDGFSAVGVWILPTVDAQNNVQKGEYTGEQCLLMQYSRRNQSGNLSSYIPTSGTKHTSSSMAIYSPYSNEGFGTVSFRYRIPSMNEFVANKENPSVGVMLQYASRSSAHTDNLNDPIASTSWINVSPVIELPVTAGEWRMASVTPRLTVNGVSKPLLPENRGMLRLVMVLPLTSTDDPYVYIDDFRITSNSGEKALWNAGNVRLAEDPIASLYWKDRLAKEEIETDFAWKSRLSRAVVFNRSTTADVVGGAESPLAQSYVESPKLEHGAGVVTFAARLDEPATDPLPIYLYGTEKDEDAVFPGDYTLLYTWQIKDTLYRQCSVDLTKESSLYQTVKRLRLHVPTENSVADPNAPVSTRWGRIWVDMLSITEPISPSVRLSNVAFSSVPGDDFSKHLEVPATREGEASYYEVADGRNSPLSQPIVGDSLMVKATVSRLQRVKKDSVRVYFTYNLPTQVNATTGGYTYKDACGSEVDAEPECPIYTWEPNLSLDDLNSTDDFSNADSRLSAWSVDSWFSRESFNDALASADPDTALAALNTIELKTVTGAGTDYQVFRNTEALKFPQTLQANTLVRYVVWATFETEDSTPEKPIYGYSVIDAEAYTDFPWYFPRNLNDELRDRYNEIAEAASDYNYHMPEKGDAFFSPYFWVYDSVPGEVFINELNMLDLQPGDFVSVAPFVELCTPARNSLNGWRFDISDINLLVVAHTDNIEDTTAKEDLKLPDPGVVPAQRGAAPLSNRSFYTLAKTSGLRKLELGVYNADGSLNRLATIESSKNAGRAANGANYNTDHESAPAVAARLYRPTGGAEHILIYSLWKQGASATNFLPNLTAMHSRYRTAYKQNGFGSEWFQAFREGGWEAGAGNEFGYSTHAERARRLSVATTYKADANGNYTDDANGADTNISDAFYDSVSGVPTSIATVDMGGTWVTRTNRNMLGTQEGAKGAVDVTHLFSDEFPAIDLIAQARPGDDNKDVQVTPRQINLDQWLIYYADPSGNTLSSQLTGLGQHIVEYIDNNGVATSTIYGGREALYRNINETSKVHVTYKALPFNLISTLTMTVTSTETGAKLTSSDADKAILGRILEEMDDTTYTYTTPDATSTTCVINFAVENKDAFTVKVTPEIDGVKYSVELKATFVVNPEAAKDVIIGLSPFCGDTLSGSAVYQPWCGSAFGFRAQYNPDALTNTGANLASVIVLYPTPGGANTFNAEWTGLTEFDANETTFPVLTGLTVDQAMEAINQRADYTRAATLGMKRVIKESETVTRHEVYNASCVGVLGDSYWSTGVTEPAIPYVAWGVYAVTIQSGASTETIQYLIPQRTDEVRLAEWPEWYAPLTQEVDVPPYFYLYSTPPESAWLNEVNVVKGTGTDEAFVEVVFPKLREGITTNGVPQVEVGTKAPAGWTVKTCAAGATSVAETISLSDCTLVDSGSSSAYRFATARGLTITPDPVAVALIRPCGAGEGGVWTGTSATGGAAVTATDVSGVLGHYIVPGETDATDGAGSVQLRGNILEGTELQSPPTLDSARDARAVWRYAATATPDANNDDIVVDPNPVWNRVRVSSTLLNTVYGGVVCGWQDFDILPETTQPIGVAENETFAAAEWVSTIEPAQLGRLITYRPRTGYTYDYLLLPPEWMGKVILVGERLAKGTPFETSRILERATEVYYNARNLSAEEKAMAYVALGGYATAERSGGAFTGKVIFNGDAVVDAASELLFRDTDDYVLAVILLEEPVSATNELIMGMCPGSVDAGAWLVSQSFYGLKAEVDTTTNTTTWTPDEEKGGFVATQPIWDDEIGNSAGEYKHRHGWVYQPIIGDSLSMSAVIRPDKGLYAQEDILKRMLAEKPTVRPMLMWALTKKTSIPSDIFGDTSSDAATKFFGAWGLSNFFTGQNLIGMTPVIAEPTSAANLSALRKNLATFDASGLLPMTFRGLRDDSPGGPLDSKTACTAEEIAALETAEEPFLFYSVMNEEELAAALTPDDPATTIDESGALAGMNDDTTQAPLASMIQMINGENQILWTDGAVMRFAVILVDTETNKVIDCQGVSNFNSDLLPVYCPWYVPEERADLNYISKNRKAGVSPYVWTYAIGSNDVWINEIRPFRQDNAGTVVELAMRKSPLVGDNTYPYTPSLSLDGWKIVPKFAPMPVSAKIDDDTRIEWERSTDNLAKTHPLYGRTVELKSWVPSARLYTEVPDLDYYAVASSHDDIANNIENLPRPLSELDYATCISGRHEGLGINNFIFLKTPTIDPTLLTEPDANGVANMMTPFGDSKNTGTMDLLPNYDKLMTYLSAQGIRDRYASGTLFGLELVRNNGVVADEIIFCYRDDASSQEIAPILERLDVVKDIETRNFASSNVVRRPSIVVGGMTGLTSLMFVDRYESVAQDKYEIVESGLWHTATYGSNANIATIPGPNNVVESLFFQPRSTQDVKSYIDLHETYRSLSAVLMGGNLNLNGLDSSMPPALFSLSFIETTAEEEDFEVAIERDVSYISRAHVPVGKRYRLTLNPVATGWFDYTVSKRADNVMSDITTSGVKKKRQAVTQQVDGQKITTEALCIEYDPNVAALDAKSLEENTSYTITLTPKNDPVSAALIKSLRENAPKSGSFEVWIIASGTPSSIRQATAADGVSATEKFWLGLDSAVTDASQVDLKIENFGYVDQTAEGGERLVQASVAFVNGTDYINQLKADGKLVLQGKMNLSDEWKFVQTLSPSQDINVDASNAPRYLHIPTDYKFFQVVLLSEEDAKALESKK